jgi:hypothetical protein
LFCLGKIALLVRSFGATSDAAGNVYYFGTAHGQGNDGPVTQGAAQTQNGGGTCYGRMSTGKFLHLASCLSPLRVCASQPA